MTRSENILRFEELTKKYYDRIFKGWVKSSIENLEKSFKGWPVEIQKKWIDGLQIYAEAGFPSSWTYVKGNKFWPSSPPIHKIVDCVDGEVFFKGTTEQCKRWWWHKLSKEDSEVGGYKYI